MTSTYLPMLLAGIAILLGLVSAALFYKVVIAPRTKGGNAPSPPFYGQSNARSCVRASGDAFPY